MTRKNYAQAVLGMLLLVFSGTVNAQKGTSDISLTGGAAIPTGVYASKIGSDEKAMFAMTGFNLGLGYFYNIGDRLGIGTRINLTGNAFDGVSATIQHHKGHHNSYYYDLPPLASAVDGSGYSHGSFLFGVNYALGKGKFKFDIRPMIGVNVFNTTSMEVITLYDDYTGLNQREEYALESISGNSFIANIGMGARYNFTKRFGLSLNFEVNATKFNGTSRNIYAEIDDQETFIYIEGKYKWDQTVVWINTNLGIHITLGKISE